MSASLFCVLVLYFSVWDVAFLHWKMQTNEFIDDMKIPKQSLFRRTNCHSHCNKICSFQGTLFP